MNLLMTIRVVFDGVSGGAPAINTQEIGTQVLVSNGETIVLGGIFQHRTNIDETKVPLLGDIPLLGWLFRNTSREKIKENLIKVLEANGFKIKNKK